MNLLMKFGGDDLLNIKIIFTKFHKKFIYLTPQKFQSINIMGVFRYVWKMFSRKCSFM